LITAGSVEGLGGYKALGNVGDVWDLGEVTGEDLGERPDGLDGREIGHGGL